MGYDRYFGFNLQQRQTLQRLLAELVADPEALQDLQDQIDALESRVETLEGE